MSQKSREEFRKYVYGPMTDDDLDKLRLSSKNLRTAAQTAAWNGDHRHDDLIPTLESIITDIDVVKRRRTE